MVLVALFFYLDRRHTLTHVILSWGILGIAASIIVMALLCIVPVPSEFLLIMNMKVYGVWWGIFFGWSGSLIGAWAIFAIARRFGRPLLMRFVSKERFDQIDQWVSSKGALGLLMARLLPLPASVVNYVAGVIRSVRIWDYTWTAAISIIPYYLGAALVFLGIFSRYTVWLFIGGIFIAAFWATSYYLTHNLNKKRTEQ